MQISVYIVSTYLEAGLLLGSVMKVVGNSLQMFKMYLFTAFFLAKGNFIDFKKDTSR